MTTKTKAARKKRTVVVISAKKPERDWVDALRISNRKGGTLAERMARLTETQRDAMVAEVRELSAKPDQEPANPVVPTVAEREALRLEIASWYYSAKAMIDHLYNQSFSMAQEMKKPDSILAYWLDPDEMWSLSNLLSQASCKIGDIIPPLPYLITDPMDEVRAIRASKNGDQS